VNEKNVIRFISLVKEAISERKIDWLQLMDYFAGEIVISTFKKVNFFENLFVGLLYNLRPQFIRNDLQ